MDHVYKINLEVKLEVSCEEHQFYEERLSCSFYNFEEAATVGEIKQVVLADEKTLSEDKMIYTCEYKIYF